MQNTQQQQQISTAVVVQRVAHRTGVALWRKRGAIGVGVLALALLGVIRFLPTAENLLAPQGVEVAGAESLGYGSRDCADTLMHAVATRALDSAHAAYKCMGGGFDRTMDEDQFVEQLRSRASASKSHFTRVGEFKTQEGGTIVYYALEQGRDQTVGYVVYLGSDGRILKIE